MRNALIAIIVLCCSVAASAEQLWSAASGLSRWHINEQALANLGLTLSKIEGAQGSGLNLELPLKTATSLEFDGSAGKFNRLLGGATVLDGGFVLLAGARPFDLRKARLVPLDHTSEAALAVVGGNGEQVLTLHYGHYDYSPGAARLDVWIMDARVGGDLAAELGNPGLSGVFVGQVSLHLDVTAPPGLELKGGSSPNVLNPNWPTQAGFDADIELQRMDVAETPTSRAGNRVAITPSAYFQNIGSADVPWYSMFTIPISGSTRNNALGEDEDCIDNGAGQCEPYGVDQGGLLVWHLYRLADGRLEQLARSGVKHAWNSINIDCAPFGGRIVGAGCADRYSVGNNADQNVLGPRSEIQAASVLWTKLGSIWDGDMDGDCDVLNPGGFPHHKSWCRNTPVDEFDRRLAVNADELQVAGARYFLEGWYLVRQDINIFNTMGFQEITPTFNPTPGNGVWTFPCTQGACSSTFQSGPVIDEFVDSQTPPAGATSATFDSAEGRVRLASTVTALGGGRYHYEYALMNFDFDRRIDQFTLPLPAFARVSNALVSDGDLNGGNNWSIFLEPAQLRFNAPTSGVLDWGGMMSFSFDAALPGATGAAHIAIDEPGIPALFSLDTNLPVDDVLLVDGFEE